MFRRHTDVLSGTKTLHGVRIDNPASWIVPEGPDAATIALEAKLEGFFVRTTGSDAALGMLAGKISGVAVPRLARSASLGATSLSQRSIRALSLAMPRGHKRSTRIRVPSLASGGS